MTTSGATHEAIGDRRSFALIADGIAARGADRDAGNHGLFKRVLLGALARRDRQPSRLAALARRYLGIAEFNDLISSVEASGRTDELAALAEAVGVRFAFNGLENLASIGSRPVVLFANHPTGGGNVLGLSLLLARQFPAHRILGNQHMRFLRSLARNMIAVDPFCSTAAVNLDALIKLRRDFGTQYQALGVFPAGISSRIGVTGKISDRPWNDAFARIARRHDALLVPVWFSGRNLPGGTRSRRARIHRPSGGVPAAARPDHHGQYRPADRSRRAARDSGAGRTTALPSRRRLCAR